MKSATMRLERLLAIRKLNQELGRRTLQVALALVAEAEAGISKQEDELGNVRHVASVALVEGDREEWLMADAQAEVAGWNMRRLEVELDVRAAHAAEVMSMYLASRSEHEQVQQLVDDGQRANRLGENRRIQAAADDWFLSKRNRPRS